MIVITTDGRTFVVSFSRVSFIHFSYCLDAYTNKLNISQGTLQGYDQSTNIILTGTQERIITPDEPTEIIDLGLYLLRGDSIVLCGLVDEEIENSIDWIKVSIAYYHIFKPDTSY